MEALMGLRCFLPGVEKDEGWGRGTCGSIGASLKGTPKLLGVVQHALTHACVLLELGRQPGNACTTQQLPIGS